MYKPLPKGLTIKKSPIEGLGLFASENINNNHCVEKINDKQCLQDYETLKKIEQLPYIQMNIPIEVEVIPYKQ